MIDLKILESDQEIIKAIMVEALPHINSLFQSKIPIIKTVTGDLLRKYILAQPEMQSFMNGTLKFELGVPDSGRRILSIIDVLVQDIMPDFTPFVLSGLQYKGGIILKIVQQNYSNITSLADAIQVTEKGEELEWLRWLLEEGSSIIIGDYRVEFGQFGRTGGAHMVLGGSWGVPSEFAGDRGDNFITRAIVDMQPELTEKIQACLA